MCCEAGTFFWCVFSSKVQCFKPPYYLGFPRETETIKCVHVCVRERKKFILKNWLIDCGGGRVPALQAGRPGGWRPRKAWVWQLEYEGSLLEECLIPWQRSVFILLSSVNGMRCAHIMEGNVLYSESTDLNPSLMYKIPSQQYQDMYDHVFEYSSLTKLTHNMNHSQWETFSDILSFWDSLCLGNQLW